MSFNERASRHPLTVAFKWMDQGVDRERGAISPPDFWTAAPAASTSFNVSAATISRLGA
jgi:hypothetical protein